MIDLSQTFILDEFHRRHHVRTIAEVKQVLQHSESACVLLRHQQLGGFCLIGIQTLHDKSKQYSFNRQQNLCLEQASAILERQVFASVQAMHNTKLSAHEKQRHLQESQRQITKMPPKLVGHQRPEKQFVRIRGAQS